VYLKIHSCAPFEIAATLLWGARNDKQNPQLQCHPPDTKSKVYFLQKENELRLLE